MLEYKWIVQGNCDVQKFAIWEIHFIGIIPTIVRNSILRHPLILGEVEANVAFLELVEVVVGAVPSECVVAPGLRPCHRKVGGQFLVSTLDGILVLDVNCVDIIGRC